MFVWVTNVEGHGPIGHQRIHIVGIDTLHLGTGDVGKVLKLVGVGHVQSFLSNESGVDSCVGRKDRGYHFCTFIRTNELLQRRVPTEELRCRAKQQRSDRAIGRCFLQERRRSAGGPQPFHRPTVRSLPEQPPIATRSARQPIRTLARGPHPDTRCSHARRKRSPKTTKALADLAICQGFINGGGGRI